MNHKIQFPYIFISCILLTNFLYISCTDHNLTFARKSKSFKLEDVLKSKSDSAVLSDFCSTISYIPLQTSEESLVGHITKVSFDDSLLFVFEKNERLLLFNNKGKFLKQIGSKGNGSNEYSKPIYFELDSKNDIALLYDDKDRRILLFDYNSKLLSVIKLGLEYFQYFIPFYNNDILCFTMKPFTIYNEGYNIGLLSKDGKTTSRLLKRPEKFDEKRVLATAINKLYLYSDTISLWQFDYDTVYRILPNKTLTPAYSFDFGKYKMPLKYRNSDLFKANTSKYPTIRDLIETRRFFFLRILWKNKVKHIIANKINNKTLQLENNSIKNNIDFGADFWPNGSINDSTLYMVVHPLEILSSEMNNSIERKLDNEFLQKLKSVKVIDNPWVIFIKIN